MSRRSARFETSFDLPSADHRQSGHRYGFSNGSLRHRPRFRLQVHNYSQSMQTVLATVRAVPSTLENENEKSARIGFSSHLVKHCSHFLLRLRPFRFRPHTVSSAMQSVDQSAFPSGIRTTLQALTGTSSGTTENKIGSVSTRLACVENRTFTLFQRSLQEESSGAPNQEKSQSVCQACLSQHD